MKIGVLMSVYQGMDYLEECLKSWIDYRDNGSIFLEIAIVHNCFKENFENGEPLYSTDGTIEYLKKLKNDNNIDFFEVLEKPSLEHEARNVALKHLLKNGTDYILTTAPDEIFTFGDIEKIFEFVRKNDFISWFSINYKNYVFDKKTYVLGFAPPRIFKVQLPRAKLDSLYFDDDFQWITEGNVLISYKNLSFKEIPKNVALPKHFTWLSNETSRKKILYQSKHFSHGAGCSFKWNDKENKLEFNEEYYRLTGQTKPELNYE